MCHSGPRSKKRSRALNHFCNHFQFYFHACGYGNHILEIETSPQTKQYSVYKVQRLRLLVRRFTESVLIFGKLQRFIKFVLSNSTK